MRHKCRQRRAINRQTRTQAPCRLDQCERDEEASGARRPPHSVDLSVLGATRHLGEESRPSRPEQSVNHLCCKSADTESVRSARASPTLGLRSHTHHVPLYLSRPHTCGSRASERRVRALSHVTPACLVLYHLIRIYMSPRRPGVCGCFYTTRVGRRSLSHNPPGRRPHHRARTHRSTLLGGGGRVWIGWCRYTPAQSLLHPALRASLRSPVHNMRRRPNSQLPGIRSPLCTHNRPCHHRQRWKAAVRARLRHTHTAHTPWCYCPLHGVTAPDSRSNVLRTAPTVSS